MDISTPMVMEWSITVKRTGNLPAISGNPCYNFHFKLDHYRNSHFLPI
jgi:hypothetical protein